MKITLGTTRAAYMLLDDKNASWSYEGANDSGYKPDGETEEEREEDIRGYIDQYGGIVIEFDGGVIVSSF